MRSEAHGPDNDDVEPGMVEEDWDDGHDWADLSIPHRHRPDDVNICQDCGGLASDRIHRAVAAKPRRFGDVLALVDEGGLEGMRESLPMGVVTIRDLALELGRVDEDRAYSAARELERLGFLEPLAAEDREQFRGTAADPSWWVVPAVLGGMGPVERVLNREDPIWDLLFTVPAAGWRVVQLCLLLRPGGPVPWALLKTVLGEESELDDHDLAELVEVPITAGLLLREFGAVRIRDSVADVLTARRIGDTPGTLAVRAALGTWAGDLEWVVTAVGLHGWRSVAALLDAHDPGADLARVLRAQAHLLGAAGCPEQVAALLAWEALRQGAEDLYRECRELILLTQGEQLVPVQTTDRTSPDLRRVLVRDSDPHMDRLAATAVAFDPAQHERAVLAVGYSDGMVLVWDVGTGRKLAGFDTHHASVTTMEWGLAGGDRSMLATGGTDGHVRIWEPEGWTVVHDWDLSGDGWVEPLAWDSRPGQPPLVAAIRRSSDKVVVRNPLSGRWAGTLWEASSPLAWGTMPDGQRVLLVGGHDGVRLWSPRTRRVDAEIRFADDELGSHAAWGAGPAGHPRIALTGAWHPWVTIRDVGSGTLVRHLYSDGPDLERVVWAGLPGGRQALAVADSSSVLIWDPSTGFLTHRLTGHGSSILDLCWRTGPKDIPLLAAAVAGGTVRTWDIGADPSEIVEPAASITALSWAVVDGEDVLVAADEFDDSITMWDPRSGRVIDSYHGHAAGVHALSWTRLPDGRGWLASGGSDGMVRIWDTSTGHLVNELVGHTARVKALAWDECRDGVPRLVSGATDRSIRVWDPASSTQTLMVVTEYVGPNSLCWVEGASGTTVAAAGGEGRAHLQLWDPNTGESRGDLRGHSHGVTCLDSSGGGNGRGRLVSGSWDGTTRIWDPEQERELLGLPGPVAGVNSVAWCPDSKRRPLLATGHATGQVNVWSASSGRRLHTISGHTGARTIVGWSRSPDQAPLLAVAGGHSWSVFTLDA